ncbi:MAG: copper chaperone PCu(A)C [Rhizomicrobium sp.]
MRIGNSNVYHTVAIGLMFLMMLLDSAMAAGLTVSDAWIRALPAGVPAGGYFTLRNDSGKTVTLTGASSPACGMLMLHQSENMGGMMKMDDVASIDIPAGGTIHFSPGGYHLMCMAPKPAIKPGNTVNVELQFAGGQTLTASFAVRNANGR